MYVVPKLIVIVEQLHQTGINRLLAHPQTTHAHVLIHLVATVVLSNRHALLEMVKRHGCTLGLAQALPCAPIAFRGTCGRMHN